MGRKCFISFKTEDFEYKEKIQNDMDIDMIDKSLNEPINSDDEDYIMRKIRENYLSDSTVTIHLIGEKSAEILGWDEQRFIKRELQASLYNGNGNTRNGILGVVLPNVESIIYQGNKTCTSCEKSHLVNLVNINDTTTVNEFNYNYYIPNDKCAHGDDDTYCVLVKWDDFYNDPEKYIEKAFAKRSHPIADKIKVYPK
ncbi:MAG: molecular chaperone Tir [Bacillales bacterium]|jgi:hypothetical protein|nr:molecular chaperone Tir [Bacillales bacterium]